MHQISEHLATLEHRIGHQAGGRKITHSLELAEGLEIFVNKVARSQADKVQKSGVGREEGHCQYDSFAVVLVVDQDGHQYVERGDYGVGGVVEPIRIVLAQFDGEN